MSLRKWESMLTPQETAVYNQLFKAAAKTQPNVIDGMEAVQFFAKSGLPNTVLSQIWEAADENNLGYLTPETFAIALKLIACAQNHIQAKEPLLSTATPLPQIEGIPLPEAKSDSTSTISSVDRNKYLSIYRAQNPPREGIPAQAARDLFLKSKLSNEQLAQIWNLADIRQCGYLDETEFIIAMHYIAQLMNKSITALPPILPQSIHTAALGNSNPNPPQSPTAQEKAKYYPFFDRLDKEKKGWITKADAFGFFRNSRLPEKDMGGLWNSVDTQGRGVINASQFTLVMSSIHSQLSGQVLSPSTPIKYEEDLLGDFGDNGNFAQETTRTNQLKNQIESTQKNTKTLIAQREQLSQSLETLKEKKGDLEQQAAALNSKKVSELEQLEKLKAALETESSLWQKTKSEAEAAENTLKVTQAEVEKVKGEMKEGEQENEQLRRQVYQVQKDTLKFTQRLENLYAEQERKRRLAAEREAADLKRKEEERLRKEKEAAELKSKEEEERLKKEEERLKKEEEEERLKKEEEERLKREEEERLKKEQEEERLKREEEERLKKEQEEERLKREEEERLEKEQEEERLKREEEERLEKKQEEERLKREEEERLKKEQEEELFKKQEEERLKKDQENERLKKEEEDERLKKEEEEIFKKQEEERLKKDQEEQLKKDQEEQLKKEEERLKKEQEEERLKREEEERLKKEEEEHKKEETRLLAEKERLENEAKERQKDEQRILHHAATEKEEDEHGVVDSTEKEKYGISTQQNKTKKDVLNESNAKTSEDSGDTTRGLIKPVVAPISNDSRDLGRTNTLNADQIQTTELAKANPFEVKQKKIKTIETQFIQGDQLNQENDGEDSTDDFFDAVDTSRSTTPKNRQETHSSADENEFVMIDHPAFSRSEPKRKPSEFDDIFGIKEEEPVLVNSLSGSEHSDGARPQKVQTKKAPAPPPPGKKSPPLNKSENFDVIFGSRPEETQSGEFDKHPLKEEHDTFQHLPSSSDYQMPTKKSGNGSNFYSFNDDSFNPRHANLLNDSQTGDATRPGENDRGHKEEAPTKEEVPETEDKKKKKKKNIVSWAKTLGKKDGEKKKKKEKEKEKERNQNNKVVSTTAETTSQPTTIPLPNTVSSTNQDSHIAELVNMGFDTRAAREALDRYDQDLEKATNFLLDQS
ncbi:hypothetical protein BY458DRAFT_438102 [Sporodiniella umbellata]|nr:hypothetical protein BY458DRAFT_438102 [Sporodiniella umbellata]